ncbi:HAD-IA family hydrolase [Nanoarchaeota archaeon]
MKYIVFDFDGTIADTFYLIKKLTDELKHEYTSEDFNMEEIRNEDLRTILKRLKIPSYKYPQILKRVQKALGVEISKEAKTFPGVHELLKELFGKYRLGILSSNSKENIDKFLERTQLAKYFDFIYSGSPMFGKDKKLAHMMKQKKLGRSDFTYIGDEKRDVLACRKLGVEIIAVTWGFNSKAFLMQAKPKHIADKPEEIEKILSDMKF